MEVGTLVYLKGHEMLYKYIVYRPDKNVYLLEKPKEISECNLDQYINVSAADYINCVIIDRDEYIKVINEKIIYYLDEIEKQKKRKPDTLILDYELRDLEGQIKKIEEKENKSENQIKAIQQLNKAVRRVQKRKNGKIKELEEQQKRRIESYQTKIKRLEKIIIYSKEAD